MIKAKIRELMGEGRADDEIAAALERDGVSNIQYSALRNAVLREEEINAKKPAVEVYVEYQLKQLRNIDDLETARLRALEKDQPQHAVTAIKAKADLLDRIVQTGQNLGVIHREGSKITVQGVMGLVHLSPKELVTRLDESLGRLHSLSAELGKPLELGPVREVFCADIIPITEEPTDPGADPPAPDEIEQPDDEPEELPPVPDHVPPEKTVPERVKGSGKGPGSYVPGQPKKGFTSGGRVEDKSYGYGSGDPGPDAPLEERVFKAAMEVRPDAVNGKRAFEGEIRGDPAGLRAKPVIDCCLCTKRIVGVPAMVNHLLMGHKLDLNEARDKAREWSDKARMSMAREYANKAASGGA